MPKNTRKGAPHMSSLCPIPTRPPRLLLPGSETPDQKGKSGPVELKVVKMKNWEDSREVVPPQLYHPFLTHGKPPLLQIEISWEESRTQYDHTHLPGLV